VNSEKKKFLLLAVAGVGAYFLFMKKSDAITPPVPSSDIEPEEIPTQSASINVPTYAAPLISYLAMQNRDGLIKYASGNQTLINAYNKMNDAEINASWEYVWGYLLRGLKLYQYPNKTGIYADGGWNTVLYNQIAAIRAKYGIF
jgi:hypothetical protein